MAKMRIGMQTGLDNVEMSDLREFWRFVDRETKFDSIWTFDHFVPPGPGADPAGTCLEGWAALAALADMTQRVRVGCLVTGVTYRHPAVLAKMAVTVDHLSNGRLEFGIGAAWHEQEHSAYGIDFPPVKERQDRLEETAQLVRLLFTAEGPVDFEGTYYQLRQAPFAPACVQRPHAPIYIGGGGEKRTLRTAARYGDAINVIGSVDAAVQKIGVLERHCADAGRDPNEIIKSVYCPIFLSDDETRAQAMRAAMAPGMGTTVERALDTMAVGNAEQVRHAIERYAEAGVSNLIMMTRPPFKPDLYRRISDEVVSAFA